MVSLCLAMDGETNNFGLGFDEAIIINSVRSRKKVTELPNCPVCSCTVRPGELEAHMALEVDRLHKLTSGGTKRKLSSSSSNLAVAGSSSGADADDTTVDVTGCVGSDVYLRVHNNRLSRLRSRSRHSPPQTGECPVCEATLPVSRLQRHALRCLKRSGASDVTTSDDDASIDVENDEPEDPQEPQAGGSFGAEYEWCGESRLRATALTETNATGATTVRRVSTDGPLVVDGDEDTELYGPPQFSPSSIAPTAPTINGVIQEVHRHFVYEEQPDEPEMTQQEKEDCVKKCNGLVEASAETRIKALKERIRELETKQNSGAEAKCLICLSSYTSPTVSIQCWHVYCEVIKETIISGPGPCTQYVYRVETYDNATRRL